MILISKAKFNYLVVLPVLFFLSQLSVAQDVKFSKGIVFSNPLGHINIDGKIEDWPEHIERYPIDVALTNSEIDGEDDFSAFFMSGCNKK